MDRSALGRIPAGRHQVRAVEEWLDGLVHDHREQDKGKPLANGTKVKIRNLMSAIFRHGMRYEFLPRVEEANPMKYVRQSGKRQSIPLSFSKSSNFSSSLRLKQRERTMVLLDCGAVLRRGELIGLKWSGHRFRQEADECPRSVVEMVDGNVKTEASRKRCLWMTS